MKLKNIHIAELAERYKGILTAGDLTEAGLSFKQIRQLSESGDLEKIGRGIYRFPQNPYDERLEIARRIPNGVFCLYSASFLHGLSDFVPSEQHLAVPKKSRYVLPDYPPVKLYFWEETAFQTGVTFFDLGGSSIKIYDPEKTVCDMCRLRGKTGLDVFKEVVKNYLQRSDRDLAKLHSYARHLRVEKTLNQYLSVLL
jgi:predicted transcriptional regulator of viral defense system